MESTLLVAGEAELPGPARLVMKNVVTPATVSAVRAASVVDGATVPCEELISEPRSEDDESVDEPRSRPNPSHRPKRGISDLMQMFNPDFSGQIGQATANPAKRRRQQLLPLVRKRMEKMGRLPTFNFLVLEYIHHLMQDGGPRSAGGMEISTIYKVYHQISPALAAVAEDCDMTQITTEELTGILMVALERSKRRDKVEVLRGLRQFFRFSSQGHSIATPTWELLASTAGVPVPASDPAVVSDVEVGRMLNELSNNAQTDSQSSLDPIERRVREVQLAAALIAEASGARPGSIYGLTLADILVSDMGGFIHLHSRGRFASIKSATSAGFIPLEGDHWIRYAPWFIEWFARLCREHSTASIEHVPLFQIPGQILGVRYRMSDVFGRIGDLVRWSTQQSRGRTYWLRKRRVGERHARLARMTNVRARDVVRAMRLSGHAGIVTPVGSYLGDPIMYMPPCTTDFALADIRDAAAASGITVTAVEQRWRRRSALSNKATTLSGPTKIESLLKLKPPQWPSAEMPVAPPYKPFLKHFTSFAVGRVMECLVDGMDAEDIAISTVTTTAQIDEIRGHVSSLQLRTGFSLGLEASNLHPPRNIQVARRLQALLGEEESHLMRIAEDWVGLARTASSRDGCPLHEPQAVLSLHSVLRKAQLHTKVELRNGLPALYRLVDGNDKQIYGGWPALRWVLAVAWVARKMHLSAPT